jgi:hypothetical protein
MPTDAERLAALPPELQELYHTMIAYRRAYPRFSGRMHEVPIPSGSGKPAPSVEPATPKEAKGFIENAPLAPPPGIDIIDNMCRAADARERISRAIDAKSQMVERIIDELIKKQVR